MSKDFDISVEAETGKKPLGPMLQWLVNEQEHANIKVSRLAKMTGIAPTTVSGIRHGRQDLTSQLLWRLMVAIAELRPNSGCAQVVALIREQKFLEQKGSLCDVIAAAIDVADDAELEEAFKLFGRKMLRKFKAKDSPASSGQLG